MDSTDKFLLSMAGLAMLVVVALVSVGVIAMASQPEPWQSDPCDKYYWLEDKRICEYALVANCYFLLGMMVPVIDDPRRKVAQEIILEQLVRKRCIYGSVR